MPSEVDSQTMEAHDSPNETKRRLVHLSGTGLPMLYIANIVTWTTLGTLVIGCVVIVSVLEVVRLSTGTNWAIYDALIRPYERNNVAGYALYMFSIATVVLVFDPSLALPAVLMLTIGDPIAGIVGSTRDAQESKQLSTLSVMFVVCMAVSVPFTVPATGIARGSIIAGVASTTATLADGFKPVVRGYVVDDNLSIPFVASGSGYVSWRLIEILIAG
ncbi:MAG: Dolichol kinase [Haloquadratum sp. J07HQX50]|nr:MAG: Dolichol kinase [Haloquadratum sp. J07HQX50]